MIYYLSAIRSETSYSDGLDQISAANDEQIMADLKVCLIDTEQDQSNKLFKRTRPNECANPTMHFLMYIAAFCESYKRELESQMCVITDIVLLGRYSQYQNPRLWN
jgi:hypothetical protein